jgi:hypothetical protein
MKYFIKQPLLKNIYTTARTFRGSGTSPVSTLATLASLGLSLTFFLSNRNKPVDSAKQEVKKQIPTNPDKQSRSAENTYFEAAPRAISGSHRSIHASGNDAIKKSGQLVLGSAALLSIMYLMRKKK